MPQAAPIPIPAFAPVLKPDDPDDVLAVCVAADPVTGNIATVVAGFDVGAAVAVEEAAVESAKVVGEACLSTR